MTLIARSMILPAIATAVVAASVIAAIVMLGGPSLQRKYKMDDVRVRNLTLIASAVNGYFRRHEGLPADLDALAQEPGYNIPRRDPETGKPYEYQVLKASSYHLCADFALDSSRDPANTFGANSIGSWAHGSGHQCFERTTDKITP
jgi:hypothetical protein